MRRLILFIAAWLILASAGSAFAQGVQTGTIRGTVKDQQDLAVPGVTRDGHLSRAAGAAQHRH